LYHLQGVAKVHSVERDRYLGFIDHHRLPDKSVLYMLTSCAHVSGLPLDPHKTVFFSSFGVNSLKVTQKNIVYCNEFFVVLFRTIPEISGVVKFQFRRSALLPYSESVQRPSIPSMTKISTKKRFNKKAAATAAALAAVAGTLSAVNTSTGRPRKKTRKSVSHQQTIQARDTLDAEYRDWRTGVSKLTIYSHPHSHHNNPALFPMLGVLHLCLI
jgi:hypothetical protein